MAIMNYLTAKGWLSPNERELLYRLASRLQLDPHATILNVGVEFGASLHCLRIGHPTARIIGVDLDNSKLENSEELHCELLTGDSGTLALQWTGSKFDLIFIDGDHSYHGVWRDMEFLKHARPGAVAAFHDAYAWEDPGKPHKLMPDVTKVLDEWKKRPEVIAHWHELNYIDSIRLFQRDYSV